MTRHFMDLLTAALVAAFSWDAVAHTEMGCGDRAAIIGSLAKNYGEASIGMGLIGDGRMLEILASAAGSWSLAITSPDGHTCVIASGDGWLNVSNFTLLTKKTIMTAVPRSIMVKM